MPAVLRLRPERGQPELPGHQPIGRVGLPGSGNLRVKEVRIAEDERLVICHNPQGAERDAAIRARMIAQLKELIDGTDALGKEWSPRPTPDCQARL